MAMNLVEQVRESRVVGAVEVAIAASRQIISEAGVLSGVRIRMFTAK